ncbi:MAG: glutamate decarboxylase [Clostridia bacterium]|nr:glutamate decarboxylase [Clostridia bacterium]
MWTVVYIAPNRSEAELVKNMLEVEGLLVTLRPIGVPQLGDSANVEVLVPETEAEEAHDILDSSVI